MRKLLLLIFLMILTIPAKAEQDTIRTLIISEWRGENMQNAYVELTNVGDISLDLSNFTLATVAPGMVYPITDARHQKRLEGTLPAGESYLFMNVFEGTTGTGTPLHKTEMLPLADLKVFVQEVDVVNDSISTFDRLLRLWNGIYSSVLFYHLDNGDSVIVDAVANDIDVNTGKHTGKASSVAGVESATNTHFLIRKANIRRGNPDWDNARGVSTEDSEWLPVPHEGNNPDGAIFTTVKVHGDYNISLESENVGINLVDTILTVPWGIWKGDSLVLRHMTIGPNMAWKYQESPVSEDSAYNIVRTGDILTLYAAGNSLQKMDFKIVADDPAQDMALVFPRRNYNTSLNAWMTWSYYYVTNYQTVIDTIGNVPFATRVDTLFSFLHKAPGAAWEIIWADGVERVDLKVGDILRVTAEDGTTVKEYYIDVQDYSLSSNAQLSDITWPEKSDLFIEGWKGWNEHTIPYFEPGRTSYYINLPYGTTNVPALKAYPQNQNAKIKMTRATSLKGSQQERTTTFEVTAQDDSTIIVYSVLFEVDPMTGTQEFRAEPFFSQIIHNHFNQNSFFEIFNPGNVPLDLSQYIVVQTNIAESPADALQRDLSTDPTNWDRRYYKYVPGYKFESLEDWQIKPGILKLDPAINPTLDPGEVFIIGRLHTNDTRRPAESVHVDIHFSNNLENAWGEMGWQHNAMCWFPQNPSSQIFLFKIENDSVLDGSKPVGDPKDYTLVEMFGTAAADIWNIAGTEISGQGWGFSRKSHIWKGNIESGGSFGTNTDDSEWTVVSGAPWPPVSEGLGTHSIEPVTVYVSTISSLTFLVSDGFDELQSIQGDLSGMTFEDFIGYISKGHPDQELFLKNASDGSLKAPEDIVAGDDTLVVVSADGNNMTRYLLINEALDDDAVLVAKEGSGYTIEITDNTGKISGIEYGTTLQGVLENIIKPEFAVLNVIDGDNSLVPLLTLMTNAENIDGSWVYEYSYTETLTGNDHYFEVVAQNGTTVIKYLLEPTAGTDDAFVLSSIYEVNQDSLIISGIPFGISVPVFFNNIVVSKGATARITDKIGFTREIGTIYWDDLLEVTSGDQSKTVTYNLNFLTELNPDRQVEDTVGVDLQNSFPNDLIVYPNPTHDRFYLKGEIEDETIYVMDLMGRVVNITHTNNLKDGISLHEHPAGLYIVLAIDGKQNIRKSKIMKK
jgi:hypothetical protein